MCGGKGVDGGGCKRIVQGYNCLIFLLKPDQEFGVLIIRKPKYHGTNLHF